MRAIETSQGSIHLSGDFNRFDADRPLVLVIRGLWAKREQYSGLALDIPEVDMAFAHLPGMHSPHLKDPSIHAFGRLFDEAARLAFGDRPFLKVGISLGGLVAMAMREGVSTVALDTPISTSGLWPLHNVIRDQLRAETHEDFRPFYWNILGLDEECVQQRDYRPLVLAAKRPLTFLVAGEALEPERALDHTPGLISADDRAWLKSLPDVRRAWFEGAGHHLADPLSAGSLVDQIRKDIRLTPWAKWRSGL
jgi:hypothetical protein